ncbi:MAG: hypothetical protein IV100_09835 [Myxococcales bacterium]|nr:hypothetical protein [Myxococcales bacterium]
MSELKALEVVPVTPPAVASGGTRPRRDARFATPGEKRTRYHLPDTLVSSSPVGYRTRLPLSQAEAAQALRLLALDRPSGFEPGPAPTEAELFEEHSVGVLSARQSTNYRGHKVVTVGPATSARLAPLLSRLEGREAEPLTGAGYTHIVLSRKYRTPFTMLLTLAGHKPVLSLLQVPIRIIRKRYFEADDIPTIGYLQDLHVGILADAMERAAVIASAGKRRALGFMGPFAGVHRRANRSISREIEALAGLSAGDRRDGWRVALVTQVGTARPQDAVPGDAETWRKIGANLLAFRSERIQPGVNFEEKAPPQYRERQEMDVTHEFTEQCGRAVYNAFAHWTGLPREDARRLYLLERIDVLTPNGKQRLRDVRQSLNDITDKLIAGVPLWADLPAGRAFSKNAERGRKAFALTGQRIYVAGLSEPEIKAAGLDFLRAVRAFGAAASRATIYAELMGVVDMPADVDLLAGACLMAGPVNQNDIGKQFYGYEDLLAKAFPGREPTSLLVWTMKAKTIADPIGNEEQLMNKAKKGALVDLRMGPHEAITVEDGGRMAPMRRSGSLVSDERAFGDLGNFATDSEGRDIAGNRGRPWPAAQRERRLW